MKPVSTLFTIGYEGAQWRDFLASLKAVDIGLVIDIRDRAQSRKRDFSKSRLAQLLSDSEIGYLHLRELGDPAPGRIAARQGDLALFREIYAAVLRQDAAKFALETIADHMGHSSVCLLCYERDWVNCHRKIVADRVCSETGASAGHLVAGNAEAWRDPSGRVHDPDQSLAA
jgi:uncharacterized protein (DUF488 family)